MNEAWTSLWLTVHLPRGECAVSFVVTTLHFEEEAAFAKLLVLRMESVFVCARFEGRKDEGLERHSSACSLQSRKG